MSDSVLDPLRLALQSYRDNLDQFKISNSKENSSRLALKLLRSRDTVELKIKIQEIDDNDIAYIALLKIDQELSKLDERLKELTPLILKHIRLDHWRDRLALSTEAWWWNLQDKKTVLLWDRFDWLWDFITLVALAISASFMFMIFKSLSVGDFSIIETFSTIAQVAGLAVLSQGALTQTGREKVSLLLERINLPSQYHSETLLLISLLLLSLIYYSHQKLDKYYISEGDIQYKKGLLSDAELTYLRGLEIDPDNDDLHTSLGTIYESLGDLKQAIKHYKISSNSGEVRGINNLGRALVSQSSSRSAIQAEAFLLMAFQYAELQAKTDESESLHILRYQLNRNLGWATLKQKKYSVAEYFLKRAIYLDESLQEVQEGGGMAYCFLANLHEQQGHYQAANKNWMQCLRKAHPETLGEYQWLLEVKKDMYASCIDTSFVITIEARTKLKDHALDKLGRCNRLYKKLQHDAQIYADSNTKNE